MAISILTAFNSNGYFILSFLDRQSLEMNGGCLGYRSIQFGKAGHHKEGK